MSERSDGRTSCRNPVVAVVRSLMPTIDWPIALRSCAKPAASRLSCSTSCESWSPLSSVSSTVERLVMTRPMTASRSASVLVSEAVRCIRLSTVPPSPCSVCTSSKATWLVDCGSSAWKSGRKPLNRTVRSRALRVWASGIVVPAAAGSGEPGPSVTAM